MAQFLCEHAEMDRIWKFLGSGILIHPLELKLQGFKCFQGSHAIAMFAHKKNYGRMGYVDDALLNIVYMAWHGMAWLFDACLHCVALLCIQLDYMVFWTIFFPA